MNPAIAIPIPHRGALWTGRILTGLITAFFIWDAAMKIIAIQPVVDATTKLGYAAGDVRPIGVVLLLATALFALPRTTVLGALVLTAYLGGATATMVQAGGLFYVPVGFGILLWVSLLLRRPTLRALVL